MTDMPDTLRTRLTDLIYGTVSWRDVNVPVAEEVADAVIRELDGEFLDFGLWLSEEMRGEPMSRIDLESCIEEWKASGA